MLLAPRAAWRSAILLPFGSCDGAKAAERHLMGVREAVAGAGKTGCGEAMLPGLRRCGRERRPFLTGSTGMPHMLNTYLRPPCNPLGDGRERLLRGRPAKRAAKRWRRTA